MKRFKVYLDPSLEVDGRYTVTASGGLNGLHGLAMMEVGEDKKGVYVVLGTENGINGTELESLEGVRSAYSMVFFKGYDGNGKKGHRDISLRVLGSKGVRLRQSYTENGRQAYIFEGFADTDPRIIEMYSGLKGVEMYDEITPPPEVMERSVERREQSELRHREMDEMRRRLDEQFSPESMRRSFEEGESKRAKAEDRKKGDSIFSFLKWIMWD